MIKTNSKKKIKINFFKNEIRRRRRSRKKSRN